MIVNIRDYIDEKIGYNKDDSINNSMFQVLRSIYDFKSKYKLGLNGILTTFSDKILFNEHVGGTVFSIKLKDNKRYIYHLNQITSLNKDKTHHKICFLNINENDECLCFTFHTKETGITTLILKDFA